MGIYMALHLYIKSPVRLILIKYLKDISEVMPAVNLELYSKEGNTTQF